MKKLYEDNNIEKIQFNRKCNMGICIALSVISLAACILLTVFATHSNKTVMLTVTCVVAVASGWFIIADIMLAILPCKYLLRHISSVRSYEKITVEGTVKSICYMTVNKWLSAYEITVVSEDEKIILLFNTASGEPDFQIGEKIKAETANRFIVNCEVVHE